MCICKYMYAICMHIQCICIHMWFMVFGAATWLHSSISTQHKRRLSSAICYAMDYNNIWLCFTVAVTECTFFVFSTHTHTCTFKRLFLLLQPPKQRYHYCRCRRYLNENALSSPHQTNNKVEPLPKRICYFRFLYRLLSHSIEFGRIIKNRR